MSDLLRASNFSEFDPKHMDALGNMQAVSKAKELAPSAAPPPLPELPAAEKTVAQLLSFDLSNTQPKTKAQLDLLEKELDAQFLLLQAATHSDKTLPQATDKEKAAQKALRDKLAQDPAFKWTGSKDKSTALHESRQACVKQIAERAEQLAARTGIPVTGGTAFGTDDPHSDIDYNFNAVKESSSPFRDVALMGCKSAFAYLSWRAEFGASSATQADTEFYPPHVGTVATVELHDPVAKQIYAKANFTALFLQMKRYGTESDLEAFYKMLEKELSPQTYHAMKEAIADVETLEKEIQLATSHFPEKYKEMSGIILFDRMSKKLAAQGALIDEKNKELSLLKKQPAGVQQKEKIAQLDKEIQKLTAEYIQLAVLRGRFLPESYNTIGAFKVVCTDQGGQQNIKADIERQAALEQGVVVTPKQLAKSRAEDHFFSAGENVAYCLERLNSTHKADVVVDASKYLTRVFDSAEKMAVIAENEELQKLSHMRLQQYQVIEGAKRKNWAREPALVESLKELYEQEVERPIRNFSTVAKDKIAKAENLKQIIKELKALVSSSFPGLDGKDLFPNEEYPLEFYKIAENWGLVEEQIRAHLKPTYLAKAEKAEKLFDAFLQEATAGKSTFVQKLAEVRIRDFHKNFKDLTNRRPSAKLAAVVDSISKVGRKTISTVHKSAAALVKQQTALEYAELEKTSLAHSFQASGRTHGSLATRIKLDMFAAFAKLTKAAFDKGITALPQSAVGGEKPSNQFASQLADFLKKGTNE